MELDLIDELDNMAEIDPDEHYVFRSATPTEVANIFNIENFQELPLYVKLWYVKELMQFRMLCDNGMYQWNIIGLVGGNLLYYLM